ncbi:MAG: hypothetical protein Q4B68_10225 [Bacteroidales bacterium]|nr:hypothetical protein [Bacteroidales bacterium]
MKKYMILSVVALGMMLPTGLASEALAQVAPQVEVVKAEHPGQCKAKGEKKHHDKDFDKKKKDKKFKKGKKRGHKKDSIGHDCRRNDCGFKAGGCPQAKAQAPDCCR